jgi:nitrous oxidase accessory protein
MVMVSDSNITNNRISSNGKDIEFRGDGLKLYYSSNNLIFKNTIKFVKDVKLNYSHNNIFRENRFLDNRFATYISLSDSNILESNLYRYNSVSIMVMGAKDTKVVKNRILSSKGSAGIGVVINGVSNFKFKNNIVKFNAKGLYIEGGERGDGIKREIVDNEISYNKEAIHFHQRIKDNLIVGNMVYGNIDDIVKDLPSKRDDSNIIEKNYWDRYEGFDRDRDNIGDSPYRVYQYASRLWEYNSRVKFFYASPLMSALNFISELAPFIEPNLLIEDSRPLIEMPRTVEVEY